jgi:uncharacterized membrane protein
MADPARDRAWTLLVTNLLVLPGLGTFLAGRKAVGALQMTLAIGGFALTLVWIVAWGMAWVRLGEMPDGLGPKAALGLSGIGLFAAAWVCSLASSLGFSSATSRGVTLGAKQIKQPTKGSRP